MVKLQSVGVYTKKDGQPHRDAYWKLYSKQVIHQLEISFAEEPDSSSETSQLFNMKIHAIPEIYY